MRVITANLNGIRSAATKGFFDWLGKQDADCVCVQEIKICAADMTPGFLAPDGLQGHFHYAEKKGYSGVGVYTRREPDDVVIGFGNHEFDAEGRYVELRFGKLSVISVYIPSGSSGEERQEAKYRFMDAFHPHLMELKAKREVIMCGDVNIVRSALDIKNWKGNQKNSGCLPEERAWINELVGADGYVDVFRELDPRDEQYTWWSNRGQAYAKNVGWRIDYKIATSDVAKTARSASIFKEIKFSYHAPLTIDYDMPL